MKQFLEHKTLRTDRLENLSVRDNEIERAVLYCLLHSGKARDSINKIDNADFEVLDNKDLFIMLKEHIATCNSFDLLTLPKDIKVNKSFLSLFGQEDILVSKFPSYLEELKNYSERRKFSGL